MAETRDRVWTDNLKLLIQKHFKETNSQVSKKIIQNFEKEVMNFYQICPKEMLDKLKNPITNRQKILQVNA